MTESAVSDDSVLLEVLTRARTLGFLGPGPVEVHVRHSRAFASAYREFAGDFAPLSSIDIGSGGGVPGLVLAHDWPDTTSTLVDSMVRRTSVLLSAVSELGMSSRCQVVTDRVESLSRSVARESASLVTARGFAGPAISAECGAGLVAVGGWLLVSEPPDPRPPEGRWNSSALAALGFAPPRVASSEFRIVGLRKVAVLDSRFPRRVGLPAKSPLW